MVTAQYNNIDNGHAPASSNRGVSRKRSPEIHAVAMYAPFASRQKFATNQIQSRRNTSAQTVGTIAPMIGPDQSVRSGMGSGWYRLCGKCHGKRSASTSVAPPSQPPMMCPHSCVVVMVHHPTIRSPANLIQRLNSTLRSRLIALLPFVENRSQHHRSGTNEKFPRPFQSILCIHSPASSQRRNPRPSARLSYDHTWVGSLAKVKVE